MRTERNVMIAASTSSPECSASDSTPKLPVRNTRNAFSDTNNVAEPTLSSAALFFSRTSSPSRIAIVVRLDCLISTAFCLTYQHKEERSVSFIPGESSAFLILTNAISHDYPVYLLIRVRHGNFHRCGVSGKTLRALPAGSQ